VANGEVILRAVLFVEALALDAGAVVGIDEKHSRRTGS
jgi:hypothetical protein